MTPKELKRLRRIDLLELLVDYSDQLDKAKEELGDYRKLLEENRSLAAELAQCKAAMASMEDRHVKDMKKLRDREISLENSGSIAEAALNLNKIFEAAQAAADQYVANVKRQYGQERSWGAADTAVTGDGR